MIKKLFQTSFAPLVATICNVLIAYAVYFLAQGCYFLENYSYFRDTTFSLDLLSGSLMFDTSAIFVIKRTFLYYNKIKLYYNKNNRRKCCRGFNSKNKNTILKIINPGDSDTHCPLPNNYIRFIINLW